jgi:DNA-binding FrmR family transcriptional regulator
LFKLIDIPLGVRIIISMTKRKIIVPLPEYDAMSKRLRRIEGQIRGIVTMIEEGSDCTDVVNQLAAAKSAFDSAAMFAVIAMATQCANPTDGSTPSITQTELRKLAGTLA